ncbi:MAG: dTMP kinase [Rhizobacter sp.]|nr:dTMP kinase [Chlorobiales bacterium]
MLITFEGIDASGKSTQLRLLREYLFGKGKKVLLVREPGGVDVSEKIRALLLDNKNSISPASELLLFSASRSELMHRVVMPALQEGKLVLMDRFYDSTTAYQGYGRGLDLDVIAAINRIASFNIQPSLTVYLDLLPEDALMRKFSEKSLPLSFGKEEQPLDRMESSGLEFYRRVRAGYKHLLVQHPHRFIEIDALKSITEIHQEIVAALKSRGLFITAP